ncbi:MAG: Fur family transcriptional regulator [Sphaerochaetaceae bacterium]
MTKARKALLALLQECTEPVSASMVSKAASLPFDQATIYRNLHYLEEQGYADSFILHCSEHGTERYYSLRNQNGGTHHHWFHCEKCHRFIDLGGCAYQEQMRAWEKQYGFTINDHTFFLTGICASCKS